MNTRVLNVVALLCLFVAGTSMIATAQSWAPLTNQPSFCPGAMLLLTDGRVLVHSEPNGCSGGNYSNWWTLTPSATGSYAAGTWKQVASLPGTYAPLFFGSAVLPDGKVVVQGGEYQNGSEAWQNLGALYDPTANTWTATTAPFASGVEGIGDAESVVLPGGTWMLAACCAFVSGATSFPDYFYFNESTLNFTSEASSTDGKADEFDEEGWTLLPNGEVLTVDAYVGSFTTASCASGGCNSELYNPSTNKWATAGSTKVQLWDSNCSGSSSTASYEVGPAVLMPNGTVFYNGASDCRAGNTATYNVSTGVWTAGPSYANSDATNDAPASIEINGNAIVMASPFSGTFSSPSNFYEWNGTTLSTFPNPSNASSDSSFVGHLLVLPTGQIMFTDFSNTVELLTSAGTYESAWQPTVTSVPSTLAPGTTYTVTGTQFNGVSMGAAYGDDFQDATNYPLVRIVNNATGNVVYCKTHGWSVGVGTGSTSVSTMFDVPSTIGTGPSELYVVTNGIPSAAQAVTVGTTASTTTSLVSSLNPSTVGAAVTFTATVSSSGGTVSVGTVGFTSGGTSISGCTAQAVSSGTATCTTTFTAAGTDSIVGAYSGGTGFSSSTSSPLSQTVNKDTTTTAVASSANPSVVGQSITFTATISGGSSPSGTVNFSLGNGSGVCSAQVVTSGVATCTTSYSAPGAYSVTAAYSGDSNNNSSTSSAITQIVNKDTTSTALASSVNPSSTGQSVTFTATIAVVSPGSSTPTGTVGFTSNGTTISGCSAASIVSGMATCTTSFATAGTYAIVAAYSGDANNNGSTSSTLSQVVNSTGIPTSTALTSSLNPSTGGQTVTFTATVTASSGPTPTGTVTFYNGATSIGTINMSAGVAKLNDATLLPGTHSITAKYNGSATDATSTSAALSQVVNLDTTTTALTASPNPSTSGQTVTLTATVTPANGVTATGTVSFYSGTTLLGNVALSGGAATLNHAFTGGTYSLTAKYDGSTYQGASTSNTVTQTVNKITSSTALASSLNPSGYGQSVTFTATITPSGPPAPSGTVVFSSNGTTITGCSAVAVSATTHTAACATTALAVGTDTIKAVYSGDANYLTSTSSNLSQVVSQATSTTALTASPASPSTGGETVVFTATVTPQFGGTVSGTVTFKNGTTTIGTETVSSAGVAKLSYSALMAGSHSMTAVYNGSTNIAGSTSPVLTYVVNLDTTTTALTASPNPSTTVQAVTLTATVTPGNGVAATGTVSFYSGTTLLGNVALSGGVATLNHTFTTTGTYSLTAKYDGSTYKAASTSNTVSQVVNPD